MLITTVGAMLCNNPSGKSVEHVRRNIARLLGGGEVLLVFGQFQNNRGPNPKDVLQHSPKCATIPTEPKSNSTHLGSNSGRCRPSLAEFG